ncbi:MAG: sll0787 family AIR synthase-like protein [Burkholderiaceae bacterium]|jgi:AIR synthase-related protein
MSLAALTSALLQSRGFAHKRDISDVVDVFRAALPGGIQDMSGAVGLGDDCAAIPDGQGGYLLLAIEGLVEDFVERMPWFAGYCSVMVNVSDVFAMGGEPVAVVDAIWSRGMTPGEEVLKGMATASARYGVPIVGGHSNNRSERGQLAVAILGRARALLRSDAARAGDRVVMAIDLRGAYEEPYPYWNASTRAPASRLREDLSVLTDLANTGLCSAAKDISMAGAIGTALMLCESSGKGARIDVASIPRPSGVPLDRWLLSFPSYGFILSVRPEVADAVLARFAERDIAAAIVGEVEPGSSLYLTDGASESLLWDWSKASFIAGHTRAPHARPSAEARFASTSLAHGC